MAVQSTVGVTVSSSAKPQTGNGSKPIKNQSGRHLVNTKLPQIPNRDLLVSGNQMPTQPAFAAASTGSTANNRLATQVKSSVPTHQRAKTVATIPMGSLPQTGEFVVSGMTFVGLSYFLLLSLWLIRNRRQLKKTSH